MNWKNLLDQKPFWSQIFFSLFHFSTNTELMYTIFELTGFMSRSTTRGPWILDDLVHIHFLSRFVLFRFLSSVYVPARLQFLEGPHWISVLFCFSTSEYCTLQSSQLLKKISRVKTWQIQHPFSGFSFWFQLKWCRLSIAEFKLWICKVMKTKSFFLLRDFWSSILEGHDKSKVREE